MALAAPNNFARKVEKSNISLNRKKTNEIVWCWIGIKGVGFFALVLSVCQTMQMERILLPVSCIRLNRSADKCVCVYGRFRLNGMCVLFMQSRQISGENSRLVLIEFMATRNVFSSNVNCVTKRNVLTLRWIPIAAPRSLPCTCSPSNRSYTCN